MKLNWSPGANATVAVPPLTRASELFVPGKLLVVQAARRIPQAAVAIVSDRACLLACIAHQPVLA